MKFQSLLAAFAANVLAGCALAPSTQPEEIDAEAVMEDATSGLANVEVVESPGGVTAWLVSEPSIPIIAVNAAWRGGSASDPEGLEGAANLMAYMMNEGAADLDSRAFGARMEELNMAFGCSVSADWTSCTLRTLSANADDAFDMMRSGLTETRFDDEPMARAVREKLVQLKQSETSPRAIARRKMNAALYPDHPYAREETPESVSAATREDLIERRDVLMARDRLLVVVVGDITAYDLALKLDDVFGALPATSDVVEIPEAVLNMAPATPIVAPLPQPQTLISFSAPGPKRADEDFVPAYVLNYILGGGGFSSRLMDEIREKRGLTYGIGTSLRGSAHLGLWGGRTQTKNESVQELIDIAKAEIARLRAEGPSDKELADAKAYLTGAYPLGFDTNSKIAGQLMYVRQNDLGLDYVATRNDLIDAVTREDLMAVADKYLDPEAFTFVLVGEPKGFE
ncbi:MAG: pitrilysin family protein [Pseudomonadota bacterium]